MDFKHPDLPALYEERRQISARIGDIEEAEAEEGTALLVGRYFKGQNNYSCPETPADYWPIYWKIYAAEGRTIKVFQFQRDKDGRSSAEPDVTRYWGVDGQEITAGEFNAAWDAFKLALAADLP